jgi:hypothetical protein
MSQERFEMFETPGNPNDPKTLTVNSDIVNDKFNININTTNLNPVNQAKMSFMICTQLFELAYQRFSNVSIKVTDPNADFIFEITKTLKDMKTKAKKCFESIPAIND